jgi:hypothetical protein
LTIIILIAISSLLSSTSGSTEVYISKASRLMNINNFGITTVTDTLTVVNNGTSQIETLDFGFPKTYAGGLESLEAQGPSAEALKIERIVNESSTNYMVRCSLAKPLAPGGTYEIKLSSVFSNLVSSSDTEFVFSYVAYPTLPVRAQVYNSTVILPKGSTPKQWPNKTYTATDVGGQPALTGTQRPLEAFSRADISISYSNDAQQLISFKSVKREITISPSGEVTSKDTYSVFNFGAELNALTLPRPQNISPIMLYDSAGAIEERLQAQKDTISLAPRFGKLPGETSFTFRLEYNLPLQNDLKRLEWPGRYRFSVETAPRREYVTEEYLVNISLPRGSKSEVASPPPNATTLLPDGVEILTYNLDRLLPSQARATAVEYSYPIFTPSIYPLQWVFSLEVIAGAFAAAFLLKRPTKAAPAAPLEKIRRFIELQDEKRALRLELEKRSEELGRGAVTKQDYRRRRRLTETRLSEINRSLATLKTEIKAVDPRYDQMARRLEKAEGEVDALRASESQITSQYRSGRISKEVYESLVSDLRKRIEKAKDTVDRTIITLREEVR